MTGQTTPPLLFSPADVQALATALAPLFRAAGLVVVDMRDHDMAAQMIPEPLATSLRLHPERAKRIGMRSALNDAAAICDLIAESIRRGGRPSKRRAEMGAVAERCADRLVGLRNMVRVPHA